MRYFQDRNTAQYYEENLVARDAIVTIVQEATRLTLLPTPASTPRSGDLPDAACTPLPLWNIAQEGEHSPGNSDQHTIRDQSSRSIRGQRETDLFDPHHRGTLAVGQGDGNGGRQYQAYCEDADESETDQTGGDPLPLVNPESCLLAEAGAGLDDRVAQSDGRLPRKAAQSAASVLDIAIVGHSAVQTWQTQARF